MANILVTFSTKVIQLSQHIAKYISLACFCFLFFFEGASTRPFATLRFAVVSASRFLCGRSAPSSGGLAAAVLLFWRFIDHLLPPRGDPVNSQNSHSIAADQSSFQSTLAALASARRWGIVRSHCADIPHSSRSFRGGLSSAPPPSAFGWGGRA